MDKFKLYRDEAFLLLVDMQEKLLPVILDKEILLENTNKLIEGINIMGLPIVVTEQYPRGLGRTDKNIKGLEKANFFEKTSFTALTDGVKSELEDIGRKKVILAGIEAHICVYQTARDLLKNGYQVFLLEDVVSSRDKIKKENGIELIRSMGGLVTNIETVLFDMVGDAKNIEFKEISQVIK